MSYSDDSVLQGLVCGHLRPSSELLGYSQASLWDEELWGNHRRSRTGAMSESLSRHGRFLQPHESVFIRHQDFARIDAGNCLETTVGNRFAELRDRAIVGVRRPLAGEALLQVKA